VANRHQFNDTSSIPVTKFAADVIDNWWKIATGVIDFGGAPWLANISGGREFSEKFEMTLFSVAWGKMIHEKNLKQKILWHCP
jgi:hypothetical protein